MDMLDQLNVEENNLSNNELQNVIGGSKISGTVVNAFTTAFKSVYAMGQNFGTAIRRIIKKKLCSF